MKAIASIASCLMLIATTLGATAHPQIPQLNDNYSRHKFEGTKEMPYRLLEPNKRVEGEKYPLVIFLHGYGERGKDNEKQLDYGASLFSNPVNQEKYPAYVVFPQCSDKSWIGTNDFRIFLPGAPTMPLSKEGETLMELIESLEHDYPIDKSRVYLVGLSMGGAMVYDLACRFPETFAAAIPICGAVNVERLNDAKGVNFLIFHGDSDDEVPAICSRQAYSTLEGLGANVDYIEFAGDSHECWLHAFNHPKFLKWMFAQKKVDGGENENVFAEN